MQKKRNGSFQVLNYKYKFTFKNYFYNHISIHQKKIYKK
jgi:hypothetical protein